MNDLAVEALHQRRVFCLRIADDHIVIRHQEGIGDLALGAERLTGTGYAENERITVKQVTTVGDDHIVADSVLTVVDTTLVTDLLNLERHKDRETLRGERSQHVDFPAPDGQNGIEPVHLLKLQNSELTEVASCR